MNLDELLDELHRELDAINTAIKSLEALARDRRPSPGRPRIFPASGYGNGANHAPQQQLNGEE